MDTSNLSLEKFGSIGGDYFEILVAIALDELGYIEGETYIPSWHKKCVPGTWIEADFIIGEKKFPQKDPLNHPRFVFAVGHATSEDSARMKFHRDIEQLLEVKALPEGDDIKVVDILFCCPRQTMGGWSRDLVAINRAIFDDHLIVWHFDWGIKLLKCIQNESDKFKGGNNEKIKKKYLSRLINENRSFKRLFYRFKAGIERILYDPVSHSQINEIFTQERAVLPKRLKIPLLINKKQKTEYKRGLIQVLVFKKWELKIIYENHHEWLEGGIKSLDQLAFENGLTQDEFERWWERLQLLSVRVGECEKRLNEYNDDILNENTEESFFFKASKPLGFVLEHFELSALILLSEKVRIFAPNLIPYISELNDLNLVISWANELKFFLNCSKEDFYYFIISTKIGNSEHESLPHFETGMAILCTYDPKFSYDRLAKATGHPKLIKHPDYARFFARGQRRLDDENAEILCETLQNLLKKTLNPICPSESSYVKKFIYRRLDGMVKQHRGGVLDALLGAQIDTFSNSIGAKLVTGTNHFVKSILSDFAITNRSGVNVEIPYILVLPDHRRIYLHRVMSDGGVGHKRKEFSSKIRTIRYERRGSDIVPRGDYFSSILVIDGNWITPKLEDKFIPIRMLTVAGWDYVVYPDGLSTAFAEIRKRLDQEKLQPEIIIPEEEPLPLAAEKKEAIKIKTKKKMNKRSSFRKRV